MNNHNYLRKMNYKICFHKLRKIIPTEKPSWSFITCKHLYHMFHDCLNYILSVSTLLKRYFSCKILNMPCFGSTLNSINNYITDNEVLIEYDADSSIMGIYCSSCRTKLLSRIINEGLHCLNIDFVVDLLQNLQLFHSALYFF